VAARFLRIDSPNLILERTTTAVKKTYHIVDGPIPPTAGCNSAVSFQCSLQALMGQWTNGQSRTSDVSLLLKCGMSTSISRKLTKCIADSGSAYFQIRRVRNTCRASGYPSRITKAPRKPPNCPLSECVLDFNRDLNRTSAVLF
jgi:hypothetical protein